MDKLSIVPEPGLKSAHEGESVEIPKDDISLDAGEVPIAMVTASGVREIRAATMFEVWSLKLSMENAFDVWSDCPSVLLMCLIESLVSQKI